jgi:hypothetical protein
MRLKATEARKACRSFHAPGPRAGDVVVVTREAVAAEIVAGRTSIARAGEQGLLVIDRKRNKE